MEQATLAELFNKINAIAINVATLTAKSEAKETNCESHQKQMADHDLRIRVLEIALSGNTASSSTSNSWKDTLINILTMAATVGATVWAIRVG